MKKLLVSSLLMLLCGCMNIVYHTGTVISTYKATRTIWNEGVCIWWNDSFQLAHPFSSMIIMYTYPFWIVDVACEFVADTVTYPWDLHNQIKFSTSYRMKHPEEFK